MSLEERGVERTEIGREDRVQTVEGRFPVLKARRSFHLRQLQQSLPIQPRQVLLLNHQLNHDTDLCLPRQRDWQTDWQTDRYQLQLLPLLQLLLILPLLQLLQMPQDYYTTQLLQILHLLQILLLLQILHLLLVESAGALVSVKTEEIVVAVVVVVSVELLEL